MKTKDDQIISLLTKLTDRVSVLEKNMATKDDLKKLATKKDLNKLSKKVDYYFKTLDRDVSSDRRRIIRIEKHLQLPFNPLES